MFAADGHNWLAMLVEHAGMGIACVSPKVTRLAARVVLLLALPLGGCATSSVSSSSLMDAHAEALPPASSPAKTVRAYPAVEDMPKRPAKGRELMAVDEQSKVKKELLAARERQAAAAKAQDGPEYSSKPQGQGSH